MNRFVAAPVLAQLKDFQRQTVDYVFKRLFGPDSTSRFLVADEAGLGKTMVARGVIARAIEHLQDKVSRIDIIYVCSNAAIATQNIRRLSINENNNFTLPTRLTLLPLQIKELSANRINFISMTPATALELHGRGGISKERVLLYQMLKSVPGINKKGLEKMLQATVRRRDVWLQEIEKSLSFDKELAIKFNNAVQQNKDLLGRLQELTINSRKVRNLRCSHWSQERYRLIGELRHLLAETCLEALEPDLVILDEFQRFKKLLHSEDETAQLARKLFHYPDVRILLLSATPYKNFTLDGEADDQHYEDFFRTVNFLYKGSDAVNELKTDLQQFRRALYSLPEVDRQTLLNRKLSIEANLRQVMCRTERVRLSKNLDAMQIEHALKAPLAPKDLVHMALVDQVGRAVSASNLVEYWKSGPYLLNFLKDYELRRNLEQHHNLSNDVINTLKTSRGCLLTDKIFERYRPLDPGNFRLRLLCQHFLENGLWRLLWLPPSLPYTKPEGVYAKLGSTTKVLIFSNWQFVPNAIAVICSYEAERLMVNSFKKDLLRQQLHDRVKPLLQFRKKEEQLTGMPVLAWLLPIPILADTIDPLEIALRLGKGEPLALEQLIAEAKRRAVILLQKLPSGEPGSRADERWYWAAPALLQSQSQLFKDWLNGLGNESAIGDGSEHSEYLREHLVHFGITLKGEVRLGPRPKDLPRVLAMLALAGPGTCALRALRRIAPELPSDDQTLLNAAYQIAEGFKTLYNLPETICLLRGESKGSEGLAEDTAVDSYWQLTLRYGLKGNLQAVLDEQVHLLLDSLGVTLRPPHERVEAIAKNLAAVISLRTANLNVDKISYPKNQIRITPFRCRIRFALRFGELKDERGKTLGRADLVRDAFNSPFRPFILASTSIGQEGLDFHPWCHAVMHWNLPANPVDLEQREGRIHRYKGHAIRKNIAHKFGLAALQEWSGYGDPWAFLFQKAAASRPPEASDIIPFWLYELENGAKVERWVPLLSFSREVRQLERLKRSLALYRLVFGQPRQEDLLNYLTERLTPHEAEDIGQSLNISLLP